MTKIFEYFLALRYRIIGWWVRWYLRLLGCKVGSHFKCLAFPTFRDIPKRNFKIGNHVVIGRGVVFEITQSGSLELGDHSVVGDYVRFSSMANITIGTWVGIAESCSIRGSAHRIARDEKFMMQGSDGQDIQVGNDVLLGTHSQVLMGAQIPDGVIIGALSLITRGNKLHSYGIFAGSPLQHIRDRA